MDNAQKGKEDKFKLTQIPILSRIVFWNVHRKDLTSAVCALATSTMAALSFLMKIKFLTQIRLKRCRRMFLGIFMFQDLLLETVFIVSAEIKSSIYQKFILDFAQVPESYKISNRMMLLVLVHGPDMRNYDSETRQSFA